eukprot:1144495-Pelagomonas_calceolata.AAC.5
MSQVEPSESHIHHASALIDRLPYEFVLGMVPDPALHHHFNVLEGTMNPIGLPHGLISGMVPNLSLHHHFDVLEVWRA